jgi:hypothetical protein
MAKSDPKPDALRRLGGGRWETKDGRFQIEPQSGTWVIVDTTQANEFGLPLVRGPFPSLGAAKEAIESARTEGPVTSPLAERLEQARSEAPREPTKGKAATASTATTATTAAKAAKPRPKEPEPEPGTTEPPSGPAAGPAPEPPPEPSWSRALQAGDRRRAKALMRRLEALSVASAEEVARAEIVHEKPALARLALERRIREAIGSAEGERAAVRAALEAILAGEDEELGVEWRLVDGAGRRIEELDVDA